MQLPYLTHDLPGIGGTLRARPEDFAVEEIPAYAASGDGEHVLCEIRKVGASTFDAIDQLSRMLSINPRDIGFAGMKDTNAVTRQFVSVPRVTVEQAMAVQTDRLAVLSAARHVNKLRLGHLAGNRFVIRIRDVEPSDVDRARAIVDRLTRDGMPNFFGEQRFGRRGDNDLLGAALLRGDTDGVLSLLLGRPQKGNDPSNVFEARRFFDGGDLEAAMRKWPRSSGLERRVLARFMKTKSPAKALGLVDFKLRRLWISALQSRLFNEVVTRRLDALGRLLTGDLAQIHAKGACFIVEDAAAEQPRADAFEISATGPLLGYRMSLPTGDGLAVEQAVYDQFGLTRQSFGQPDLDRAKGDRRPIRVRPADVELSSGSDEHGPHVTLAFTLPPGAFATVLLGEVMKPMPVDDVE